MVFFPRFHFYADRLSSAALLRANNADRDVQPLSAEADIPHPQPNPEPDLGDVLGVKLNLTWIDLAGRLRPVWWVSANWWLDAAGDDPGWPVQPRTRDRARAWGRTQPGQPPRKSWQ